MIIPDTQVKPGVDTTHLDWAARAVLEYMPDTIVVIGDWWDMPSLSKHAKPGSIETEGARVLEDIEAGNAAFERFYAPIREEIDRRVTKHRKRWTPRCEFLFGNHEYRVNRAVSDEPKFQGMLTTDNMLTPGFNRNEFLKIVVIDGIRYCLTPEHSVLMADLTYKALGDLCIGDKVLAFDENKTGSLPRRYRQAEVMAHSFAIAPTFKVTLSDGSVFTTTADHRWLGRLYSSTEWKWFHTHELDNRVQIPRLFDSRMPKLDTYEAGWLSGMFDGEGHLSASGKLALQIGVSQNPGYALDRMQAILDACGVKTNQYGESGKTCRHIRVQGSANSKVEFLAKFRPDRLIKKFKPEMLGRVQIPMDKDFLTVVSVVPAGVKEIVQIQTTSQTLIVEGLPHHNCHYFPNPLSGKPIGGTIPNRLNHIGGTFVQGHQQGFQYGCKQYPDKVAHGLVCGRFYSHHEAYRPADVQNCEWNGIVVLNEVRNNGDFDLMPLSYNYLRDKFS